MHVYSHLTFPDPPPDRPYAYINMVATIDGKILSGGRDDSVLDLGSKNDHLVMKHIEASADAVIVGAQTVRASPAAWSPAAPMRVIVTRSGDIPSNTGFFDNDASYVATTEEAVFDVPPGVKLLRSGKGQVDLPALLLRMRKEFGVSRLLALGGSELNAQLLGANLVDELFITIAPKVKLGRNVPTYAGGEPLSRENLQRYQLIEHHAIGDEIFIRYRREAISGNETA